MRRLALVALTLIVALNAFAHAGEMHTYMGTVTTLHGDGSFMLQKTDGKTMHVEITKKTTWLHADGKTARPAELAKGKRVVVTIAKDGRTATKVKLAAVARR
ncbi:MAG TPA: hypothetical protein VF698_17125 [Thermoanaerobaculia bacterium]|jgi:hypothetical protein